MIYRRNATQRGTILFTIQWSPRDCWLLLVVATKVFFLEEGAFNIQYGDMNSRKNIIAENLRNASSEGTMPNIRWQGVFTRVAMIKSEVEIRQRWLFSRRDCTKVIRVASRASHQGGTFISGEMVPSLSGSILPFGMGESRSSSINAHSDINMPSRFTCRCWYWSKKWLPSTMLPWPLCRKTSRLHRMRASTRCRWRKWKCRAFVSSRRYWLEYGGSKTSKPELVKATWNQYLDDLTGTFSVERLLLRLSRKLIIRRDFTKRDQVVPGDMVVLTWPPLDQDPHRWSVSIEARSRF